MTYFGNLINLYRKVNKKKKPAKKPYKDGRRKKPQLSRNGSVLNNKFAKWDKTK